MIKNLILMCGSGVADLEGTARGEEFIYHLYLVPK